MLVLPIPFCDHFSSRSFLCLPWSCLIFFIARFCVFYSLLLVSVIHLLQSALMSSWITLLWCSRLPVYLQCFFNFCIIPVPISRNAAFLFSDFFQELECTVSSRLSTRDKGLKLSRKLPGLEDIEGYLIPVFLTSPPKHMNAKKSTHHLQHY